MWAANLAVEGRVGGPFSPTNPNPPIAGRVSRVCIEAIYQIPSIGGPQTQDAAAMGAKGFYTDLGPNGKEVSVKSKNPSSTPRIRSKGELSITGGNAGDNLVAASGQLTSASGAVTARFNTNQIGVAQEQPVDPFFQLAWNDVKRADASGPKLAAGTYVLWQDGSLHYYDKPYSQYVIDIMADPDDPGSPAVLPPSVKLVNGTKKVLELDSSVYVQGTSNTDDFALITRTGAPEDPPSPNGEDNLAAAIWSNGWDRQFFNNFQPASGDITLTDGSGRPMFSAQWSSASMPTLYSFNFRANGPYSQADVFRYFMNPNAYPGATASGNFNAPMIAQSTPTAVAGFFNVDATQAPGTINPPNVSDNLSAADVEIVFKGDQQPVTLSCDGDVRLTGSVRGTGGSITSAGDIRVVGLGADFSTGVNSADGVNMYAQGDIVFSSLQQESSGLAYADVSLRGIV